METVEFCIEVKPIVIEILNNYFNSKDFIKNITLGITTFEVEFVDKEILKTGLLGFYVQNVSSFLDWDAIYLYLSLDYFIEKVKFYETLPNASMTLDVNYDIYNTNSTLYFDYLSFPNNWTGIIKERNVVLLNTEYYFSNKSLIFSNCNIYIDLMTSKMFKVYLKENSFREYKNNYIVSKLESGIVFIDEFFNDNERLLKKIIYELKSFVDVLDFDSFNEYNIKKFVFEFNYSFIDMKEYKESIIESLYLFYSYLNKNLHFYNINLDIKVPLSESEILDYYNMSFNDIIEKFKFIFSEVLIEYDYLVY